MYSSIKSVLIGFSNRILIRIVYKALQESYRDKRISEKGSREAYFYKKICEWKGE
jgi:hypothetical protein